MPAAACSNRRCIKIRWLAGLCSTRAVYRSPTGLFGSRSHQRLPARRVCSTQLVWLNISSLGPKRPVSVRSFAVRRVVALFEMVVCIRPFLWASFGGLFRLDRCDYPVCVSPFYTVLYCTFSGGLAQVLRPPIGISYRVK